MMKHVGIWTLGLVALIALAAPLIAPHAPAEQFRDHLFAPPMPPHIIDDQGRWHMPFFYPLRLVSRLESRYEEDRTVRVTLGRGDVGMLGEDRVRTSQRPKALTTPWFPLGTDSFGRDVLSRLLYGARLSLGVAVCAVIGALLIGVLIGAAGGYAGGWIDETLMRLADFVIVLPAIYVILALRSMMPLVLEPSEIFLLVAGILALVGWPFVARAVRAVVAIERRKDYAAAAQSLGARPLRILGRHLLPACGGVVATQAALLLPAFIIAEATLSYVGLGFPGYIASWGSMLHEAADVTTIANFPWTLAPAMAIFVVVLSVNLAVERQNLTLAGPRDSKYSKSAA